MMLSMFSNMKERIEQLKELEAVRQLEAKVEEKAQFEKAACPEKPEERKSCRPEGPCGPHHGSHCPPHGKPPRLVGTEVYAAMSTEQKLSVLLHELHHMRRFGPDGRGGQGRILKLLDREGVMTQRDLTERLRIQPGSVSEVIGKLERAGLVERSENADDRRTADVRLTDAGRAKVAEREAEKADFFSALSPEEQTQLLTLLEKLYRKG